MPSLPATCLQLVVLDVVPEGGDDGGSGGRVNAQQTSQPTVQFELHRLIVQQQQQSAFHVFVAWTFDLYAKERETTMLIKMMQLHR